MIKIKKPLIYFKKKIKMLIHKYKFDENEILPFCTRCLGIGASVSTLSNFCHQCGSEGTCIEIKRKNIFYV